MDIFITAGALKNQLRINERTEGISKREDIEEEGKPWSKIWIFFYICMYIHV